LLSELSVSVVALVTVPPGTAASAAAEAEDRVVPVSAVSLELELVVEVELEPVVELEDDDDEDVDEFVVWRLACERWCFLASAGAAPPSASTVTVARLATVRTMPFFIWCSLLVA
jgi:hypothetical protein